MSQRRRHDEESDEFKTVNDVILAHALGEVVPHERSVGALRGLMVALFGARTVPVRQCQRA
jgi:hypothetical protein